MKSTNIYTVIIPKISYFYFWLLLLKYSIELYKPRRTPQNVKIDAAWEAAVV